MLYHGPMAAVVMQNVNKQFGTQVVLRDVTLEFNSGEIVGMVGANGSGKTTLFRLLSGEVQPETGTVTRSRGLEIGLLKQEPDLSSDSTLRDGVAEGFVGLRALEDKLHSLSDQMATCSDPDQLSELMAAYERVSSRFIAAGGHGSEVRLNEILGGLGFTLADGRMLIGQLSGGQRCRAALGKLLLKEGQFLLLDEPTNHLDIDAVGWLEKFLMGHRFGAVIVSHDRYLLDRLCDRIVEVEHTIVRSYPGNYSNYAQVKSVRALTEQRQYVQDAAFIKKERDFIAKHIAGQRTKEAQGRRKRLERRLAAGEFVTETSKRERTSGLSFERSKARNVLATKVSTVLRCDGISMSYGDKVLLTDLTFQVSAGERLGITGPNGTGKTTLLRIILGEVTPTAGTATLDRRLNIGYYAQEHMELDPNRSVLDEIHSARPELSEQDTRNLLGGYRFSGDDVFKKMGMLSGGEQSRIRLATLILSSPDVLILDEPTNHLDIPSREILEKAIQDFAGTIIVVSHDRYFLDCCIDRLLVTETQGHSLYSGNYSFYREQIELARTKAAKLQESKRKKTKEIQPARQKKKTKSSPYDRLSAEELEVIVIERETELAVLQERFGDPTIYKDPDALAELKEAIEGAESELSLVDEAWHQRAELD